MLEKLTGGAALFDFLVVKMGLILRIIMSKIVKTEMKGTGGGRWCRRAEAKSLSKVKRRSNDKEAIKEETTPEGRLIEFEVNYTDRITGKLEVGGIVAPETEIGKELKAEVNWLLSHADLSKPWSLVGSGLTKRS